jgi:FkbM family methyltransferase
MSARNLLVESRGFNRCVLAREGYIAYNGNDIYIGQAIERYGEYGELEAQLLRQMCPPGAIAVEVGANIGTHTVVLARAAGPSGWVVAYEPQRMVFQTLCANLALNTITNVDARSAAVGAEDGHVTIPDIDYAQPGNFGGVEVGRFKEGRRVRKVCLDDDLDLPRVDLVKIDVEGMELEVLRGAGRMLAASRPLLYVENDRIDRSEALIRHLLELDYRLYWHLPPLYNPQNYYGDAQNLYPGIVSVNMMAVHRSRAQNVQGMAEVRSPAEHPMHPPQPG